MTTTFRDTKLDRLSPKMLAELRASRKRVVKRHGSRVWYGTFAGSRNETTVLALVRRGLMAPNLPYTWSTTFVLTELGGLVADGLAMRERAR